MVFVSGINNYLDGSVESTTAVGAVVAFFTLILVFFLYINRKWCFNSSRNLICHEEPAASTKFLHQIGFIAWNQQHENSNSDSDEELLRRLKLQNVCCIQTKLQNRINDLRPLVPNLGFSGLQEVTIDSVNALKDPLGVAERGKVGIPSSHSECSSNDSAEISLDGTTRLIDNRNPSSLKLSEVSAASIKETRFSNHLRTKQSAISVRHEQVEPGSFDDASNFSKNKSQECIVVLAQEHLLDTTNVESLNASTTPRRNSQSSEFRGSGSLEVALLYDAPMRKMTVHVLQARGIRSRDSGHPTHTQVRLLMLPNKKQKHKTKIRSGEHPQFMESFLLHRVNPEEVNSMGLRIRVYGCERMRRERLIGEAVVNFGTIDLELETNLWLTLEPRNYFPIIESTSDLLSLARSDSTGLTNSMQHGGVPELLLGLSYSGTTGRLTAEIVKGSHFRNLPLHKAPDTYVKLCLVDSMGQEMARAKSSTKRGQPNPLFKEAFVFQVALFQLNDVTLMASVYAKRNMKRNEMVGWFSLGLNSSGPEEMAHWVDMRDAVKGELLTRWHVLVDS